nr:hypothetical protein [Rhodothalassium salexigens]
MFYEHRVRVVFEFHRRRDKRRAKPANSVADFKVDFHSPRDAGDIIDDDCNLVAFAMAQKGEHPIKSGTVSRCTRRVIGKNINDIEALEFRKFAAPDLLRGQAITTFGLAYARYPSINDRVITFHGFKSL